jgi:hypothetical protein
MSLSLADTNNLGYGAGVRNSSSIKIFLFLSMKQELECSSLLSVPKLNDDSHIL